MRRYEVFGKRGPDGYSPSLGFIWANDRAEALDAARARFGDDARYVNEAEMSRPVL
jgi:hypothetical protein